MMHWSHICLVVALFAVAYGVCPSGWQMHSTNCFFLSRDNETMTGAEKICEIIGRQYGKTGRLALINDAGTDKFLFDLIDASNYVSYYIGANDIVEEGKWMWTGTTKAATYVNWGKDQPNNRWGSEHCAVMRGQDIGFPGLNRTWTDDPCTDLNNYICEISQIRGAGIVG